MGGGNPRKSTIVAHAAAAAIAIVATVLMTWPLAESAGDHILKPPYYWDAYTNAMIMGGRVDALLGRGPLSLYDDYFFAPLPNSIVFNENLFGLSIVFAPFYLLSGQPLWAYNMTLLCSLGLSAFFTYLLVRRLTGSWHAGVLAGVAFAFCPYVMFEIGRIQLVATQWIPACFLMLQRAIERKRLRDVILLWGCYLLQIGTCMYYAMFLIPLLALVGGVLLVRHRPPRRLYQELVLVGAAAAVLAILMVAPYFTARGGFDLERSLAFAASYDGKLGFFGNVHATNRTLTFLHHRSILRGAHEEIAFPGFTVLGLLALSLGVPIVRVARHMDLRRAFRLMVAWLSIAALAFTVMLLAHSMLAGALVFGLGIYSRRLSSDPFPFAGRHGLYFGLFLLAIAMFLGLTPVEWLGDPVRGLYYYFHTYFPGFNGIRKVSRQAVMTTFAFAVLASFGSAWLFSKVPRPDGRAALFVALLASTCFELRTFPHPWQRVWAGSDVPQAYAFMADLPEKDLVAVVPQSEGLRVFRGDAGRALHNYLMLFHKHRSLNGQSSYVLPVTDLVEKVSRHLPDDGARRILQAVGARHILIHGNDLASAQRSVPERLAADLHYRRVFQQGGDSVFSLVWQQDPTLELMGVPSLPRGARRIAQRELRPSASVESKHAFLATDDDPSSFWSTARLQARDQLFELVWTKPERVVAFEIENPWHLSDVPLSFELDVARGDSPWRTVARQPLVRVYEEQIYAPKNFVFRVVLDAPVLATRMRIRVGQPVPGHHFIIHEAHVYVR